MSVDHREEKLRGVEELIAWLREHADIELPCSFRCDFNVFCDSRDELLTRRRQAGLSEKSYGQDFVGFCKSFSGNVTLALITEKEHFCRRVKVGERFVPATPERVEEIYEWQCDESLLAHDAVGKAETIEAEMKQ